MLIVVLSKDMFFHEKKHPKDTKAEEVTAFITHLAVKEKFSASTQNQAFFALLFLFVKDFVNEFASMICTHISQNNRLGVQSPVDF